jgi:predicted Zn-dependent protease
LPLSAGADSGPYAFLLATTLQGDGEIDAAFDAYAEAIRQAPVDPFVRIAHAELLAQTGRLEEALAEIAEARRLAPDEAAVHPAEARIAIQGADRDPATRLVARAAFERWLADEPDDLEALVSLGQIYLGDGDAARAVEVLERAAMERPGQPMIEGLRSRALTAAGETARAEVVQRALLHDHPERLEVRFELAEALSTEGRLPEAIAVLEAAPPDQATSPELRRRIAVARLLADDLAGARAVAAQLLGEFAQNSTVRVLAASIEQADGEWERVIEHLGPIASRSVAPEPVVSMQVEALERLGRTDAALEFLDARREALSAAGRANDAISAALQAAEVAVRASRFEEAERRTRAISALAPGDAENERLRRINVAWMLADSAAGRKDWAAVTAALEGIDLPAATARRYEVAVLAGDARRAEKLRAALERGKPEEWTALAEAELRLERRTEAVGLFRRVTAAQPDNLRARFGLASTLERLDRIDESAAEFELLLGRAPDHAPALNYLGYMWIERARHLERAVEMVRKAVRLDPSSAAYVDSLGWGMYRMGQAAEAVPLLERANRLEPDDATILEHLGDALASSGQIDRARAAYERALFVAGGGDALSAKIARISRPTGAS